MANVKTVEGIAARTVAEHQTAIIQLRMVGLVAMMLLITRSMSPARSESTKAEAAE